MEQTEITAPLSGRVMSAGTADDPGSAYGDGGMGDMGDMGGTGSASDAFITIMDVSSYRVEGRINELNRGALTEGMRVIVRSRTDTDRTWSGTIDSIDWEKPVSDSNNNMMYGGMNEDEMTTSSKYPFYVVLDSTDDLILGQHVYIEPDLGQEDEAALALPSWYIVDGAFVWAADARGKLEKRAVELGDYDPDMDTYEILSGLDYTDYIAFPEEGLTAGTAVVYYDESSFGGEEEFFGEEGGFEGDFGEEFYAGEDFPIEGGAVFAEGAEG